MRKKIVGLFIYIVCISMMTLDVVTVFITAKYVPPSIIYWVSLCGIPIIFGGSLFIGARYDKWIETK